MSWIISLASRLIPRHYLQMVSGFVFWLVGFYYYGNKYEDPITGKKYRKLLPYGRIDVRPNALAPHSLSLERHRLLWLYLKEKTNFFSAQLKVLHIAPEYCFIKRFESMENLDYTTADLNSPWAKLKFDIQSIPFPDDSFDVILCNHVLEHVPDDVKAMKEFFRVMKPNGFGIFQVPLDSNLEKTIEDKRISTPILREKYYGQRDHLRLYGKDYPKRLRNAGFIVSEDDFVRTLHKDIVTRFALPSEEVIYLCKKPIQ